MAKYNKKYQTALQLYQAGKLIDAENVLTLQLKKKPKCPDCLRLLGIISSAKGDIDKAVGLYRKVLEFAPKDKGALLNLAGSLFNRHLFDEAKDLYHRYSKLEPRDWNPKLQLGIICKIQKDNSSAEEFFEQGLILNPSSTDILINLIMLRLNTGELSKMQGMAETIESMALRCIKKQQARELAMIVRMAPMIRLQTATYVKMLHQLNKGYTYQAIEKPKLSQRPNNKLRIGYLAGEFGDHPVSHAMWDVFEHHDRDRFEIFVYTLTDRQGAIDRIYIDHIKNHCDEYVDISRLPQRKSAERIAQDDIDILVNLSGYMFIRSVEIGAFRPSAINVYWLGHGGTLGLSSVDYVIANDIVIPESEWPDPEDKEYMESVISLPESYHCAPTPIIPECTSRREDYGLDESNFVFCAFNNPAKIDSEAFDAWMNILKRVPKSQLWLSNAHGDDDLQRNLGSEAKTRGVDPERLVFATRIPDKAQHLARHQLADLFLDAFSYNASTTAIDALWTGLPVLTRLGNNFFSKICPSHVINAGLPEMVCDSIEQFENKAVELANNSEMLAKIRKQLIATRKSQPLFDVPRFVRHLELGYQQIWGRHQSGQAPTSFRVKAENKAEKRLRRKKSLRRKPAGS